MSAPFLIIKTGSTVPSLVERRGDFEEWIRAGLGVEAARIEVASVYTGETLPDPRVTRPAGVIVTGSPAMVTAREPWSERAASWLRGVVEAGVPLLGICYGHQLLAHALGGRVGPNPRGREIGSVEIDFNGAPDPLLGGLGSGVSFHATHVESVLELPPGARLLAGNRSDPHHAFALGRRTWGVQFHPEFDADIMRGYIHERRDVLLAEGLDPEAIHRRIQVCPEGPKLLARFGEIALAAR